MTHGMRVAIVVSALLGLVPRAGDVAATRTAAQPAVPRAEPSRQDGRSATLLPNGTWLLAGGRRDGQPVSTVSIWDPESGRSTTVGAGLGQPRADHTATSLRDGTVLILGGRDRQGRIVETAEFFTPATGTVDARRLPVHGRAEHTATLLTDGRVLVAGGVGKDGRVRGDADIWDPASTVVAEPVRMNEARRGHRATLVLDGSIDIEAGVGADGRPAGTREQFFPETEAFGPGTGQPLAEGMAFLAGSLPANGASGVDPGTFIALRFSRPLRVQAMNTRTVILSGPDGHIDATVIAAEQGRLAFVNPAARLAAGSAYTVSINGAVAPTGDALPATSVSFTTAAADGTRTTSGDDEEWTPDANALERGWRTGRPDSSWRQLPPLQAPPGVTAMAGQVLRLNGLPLADVTLDIDGHQTRTDRTGRFLLELPGMTSMEERPRRMPDYGYENP